MLFSEKTHFFLKKTLHRATKKSSPGGGKIFFIPKAMIWHKVSASFGSQYYFEKWKRKQLGKIKIILKNHNLLR